MESKNKYSEQAEDQSNKGGIFTQLKEKFFKKKDKTYQVPFYKLFSYSDRLDVILLAIGLVGTLISSAIFPLVFLLYGKIAGAMVGYQTYFINKENKTGDNTDFDGIVNDAIKFYVLLSFLSLLAFYLSHVCFNTAAERQIKRIRRALFLSILRQDMGFFDKNTPGELNSTIISNIENIKTGIDFKFSDCVCLFGRGFSCLLFSLVVSWKFTVVFLPLIPVIILCTNMMIRVIKKYSIKEFKAYGSAGRIAQEILSSLRTVLSFGMQKRSIREYRNNLADAEFMAIKKGLLKGIFEGLTTGLLYVCFGIGVIYAVYLSKADCEDYSPSNMIAAFFSLITATFSLGQAIPFFSDLAQSRAAAFRVFEIIETESAIDAFDSNGEKLDDLQGEIEFEDIHFSYPTRQESKILNGLTLNISAGKTVAFCGSSGCGKSTSVGLLQRFYLPESGIIKIDGIKIEDLNLRWLRNQMALVSQEPILFTTTIRENIRLGRLDATDADIEEAARNANAHNFIMQLSKQYDTEVGERGTQLSGGQKQRIAIARALLRNPKILLLDEATSALDNESEKIVQDALDKAKIGRTTLVIAHRLSTIRNADIIVGMANGRVQEMGTHDELMQLKGIYYELVTSQTAHTHQKPNRKEKAVEKPIDYAHETITEDDIAIEEHDSSDEDDEDGQVNYSYDDDLDEDDDSKKKPNNRKASKTSANINKDEKIVEKIGDEDTNQKKKRRFRLFKYERKLLKFQRRELVWIIIGIISQVISGMMMPGVTLAFLEIYTIFSEPDYSKQIKKALEMMGVIMALGFTNFVVTLLLNYGLSLAGARLTKRIRVKMFEAMLRQEVGFHDLNENKSSVLSTRLASNPPFCKGLTTDKMGLLAQGCSGIGFAIILSFVLSWKLCLVMLIFVPITFFSGVITGKTSTNTTKVNGKYSIEEGGRLTTEVVENIRTVVSLGREKYFIKEFDKIFNSENKKTYIIMQFQALCYAVSNSILFFVQLTAFSFGYYLIKNDGLPVSNLFRVYAAMTFSSVLLGRVYSTLPDQKKAKDATKTSFKIIDRKSKIDSLSEHGIKLDKVVGDIEFKNVHFEYPTRPGLKILSGFNLSIRNGETNALVGPSGCGKSTTISLLLRFYDALSGSVTLDGVDIRELNIQWLRSQIGIVSQEPVLFNYSIKENIALGDTSRKDIPIEEIIEASIQSNINNKIQNLPEQYDTIVGTRGGQLSGGEKQRIAIARALIRKPKLLLLDEATSALDTQSEQVVQEALENAQKGRTCIVIAHRLSTIQNSDKICVCKDGKVLEEGTHAELMQMKGFYYKLQTQNRSLAH